MDLNDLTIHFKVVTHSNQRYNTVGDVIENHDGSITIVMSDLGDLRRTYAVGIHELVEQVLCARDGVTNKEIDEFDLAFEKMQNPNDIQEPGDHPDSPYHAQHQVASAVERSFVEACGLNWNEHDDAIMAMMAERKKQE